VLADEAVIHYLLLLKTHSYCTARHPVAAAILAISLAELTRNRKASFLRSSSGLPNIAVSQLGVFPEGFISF